MRIYAHIAYRLRVSVPTMKFATPVAGIKHLRELLIMERVSVVTKKLERKKCVNGVIAHGQIVYVLKSQILIFVMIATSQKMLASAISSKERAILVISATKLFASVQIVASAALNVVI